jgi:hypothetical protein
MQEKLIDSIKLENDLILELYDSSRRVAGDTWLVSLVARVEVRVKPEYFQEEDAPHLPFEAIRAAVGEKATYRHEKTRNFIVETEKDDIFTGLKERFLETNLGYLSSPDFPRKLILKQYDEAQARLKSWTRQ